MKKEDTELEEWDPFDPHNEGGNFKEQEEYLLEDAELEAELEALVKEEEELADLLKTTETS